MTKLKVKLLVMYGFLSLIFLFLVSLLIYRAYKFDKVLEIKQNALNSEKWQLNLGK